MMKGTYDVLICLCVVSHFRNGNGAYDFLSFFVVAYPLKPSAGIFQPASIVCLTLILQFQLDIKQRDYFAFPLADINVPIHACDFSELGRDIALLR